MKNKNLIERLAEKGIVGTQPPIWVPFFFAIVFGVFGYFVKIININWNVKLYWISGFCIIWGILHWIVVRKINHLPKNN